ncbi:MAG: hypothetical protein SWZ49_04840 [Cyanobacteriota bacterium]|nr:hypothetical protein [Cyanobacteriota bacterium]
MKEILVHIGHKKQEYAQLDFFHFLKDKSIPAKQRLSFAPYFAPFVMGFGELNQYVWREEPTSDPIQEIINQHTYEDDSHWIWFLEDLKNLGYDKSLDFTGALKVIWSKELKCSRQTFYEIYRYTYKANPIYKYVVMEAIEAIADIFLSTTKKVAEELESVSECEYRYFGMTHFSCESNHSKDSSKNLEYISSIQMEKDVEKEALELVEKVFELFSNFVDVLLTRAEKAKF